MMRPDIRRLSGMSLEDVPNGVSLLAVATFQLSRSLKSAVTRTVAQDPDIGLVSWRVLLGLSLVSDATQSELVEFTRTEQAQLSRVLKSMEVRGLISSAPDPDDGRRRMFRLTRRGQRKYRTLLPDVITLAEAMDAALEPHERVQFIDMCKRIAAASQTASESGGTSRHALSDQATGGNKPVQLETTR